MPIPTAVLDQLRAVLGERLSTGASDLDLHAASETFHRAPPPDAVAFPLSTDEVSQVLRICNEARDLLAGNGLLLENHVVRHMTDMEVVSTYEGTDSIQALLVGRDITGISAFS